MVPSTLATPVPVGPILIIKDLINIEIDVIPVNLSSTEIASLFERHNLLSAPVVDEENRVLGRITVDDVLDVIIEEADHSLLDLFDEHKRI